jgi:ubiquinone/menaquinone biosynthesis C-methylase UbiE
LLFQFDFLQDLCPVYYKGPEIIAKAAASLYNEDHRENINILDVAAGTGFVAEQVK